MTGDDLLVLRRGESHWAVARSAVRSFHGVWGGRVALKLADGELVADAVLGTIEDTAIRPTGPVLRHFWPQPCLGLAVFSGLPIVVVNPNALPRALSAQEGDVVNGRQST